MHILIKIGNSNFEIRDDIEIRITECSKHFENQAGPRYRLKIRDDCGKRGQS